MKIKQLAFFTFVCLFAIGQALAASYMYKWIGPKGEVKYTERPPASGITYEKIRIQRESGNSTPIVEKQAEKPTEEKKTQSPGDKQYGDWREENCKIAKQNLDILTSGGRIPAADGEGLMTDEEIAAKIKEMQAQIEKYCGEKKDEKEK